VLTILKNLDHAYPYHQAIGFLMLMAGYPQASLAKFKSVAMEYDFYLAHGLKAPQYSSEWRLFFPAGLT
jgi:hypothetical protein